jgi:hypothetical protein
LATRSASTPDDNNGSTKHKGQPPFSSNKAEAPYNDKNARTDQEEV